mmetsp:Transcript_96925/g.312402  ORF Transcript_96925/g.312402 Transcript_96925/m.312402 type:complete len:338 (-) Transcript_96925:116-1129(-)
MGKKSYVNYGKSFRKPKRPFEKERLDSEMKIIGEYGLKNKREVWRVNYALAKIRTAARTLLTLDEKSEQRMFQGDALLRRMTRLGLLLESEKKLDYVLGLTTAKIMERRLQTKVFKLGLAKSIHHARTLIRQRHIRVGKQICDIPSFLVRLDSEKHIDFALTSPFGGGRPGRVRRKKAASGGGGGGGAMMGAPRAWAPGDMVIIRGLKAKPELNGKKAMVVPPTAEERETLKGTGRLIVRLIDSGEQFAVKPDNLKTTAEEADDIMGSNLEDVSMYNPAIQSEAAKLRESGKLDDLANDPELKPIFEDIKKNGMGALEKYWNDDKLMAKISKVMGTR